MSQGGSGNGVSINAPNFIVDPSSNHIIGYCYDNAGNLIDESGCPAAGSPHRYSFDATNRLIQVNTGSATAAYSYIGPVRVKKVAGATTTIYVYSGNNPIAEYAPGAAISNPTREYIYSGSRVLASVAGSTQTYYHPDHLSNRAETDSTGTAIRRMGHFPYGDNWYDNTPAEKWKFTSYERDSATGETGLDYAMFRYYASTQARFISADLFRGSLNAPQSLNRYTYVNNDPVNRNDPSGLVSLVGGCSGDDWCSGAIDLAGGGFGDDPGRDTCPKDAPGCFNNGPERGGGGGSEDPQPPKVNLQALKDCIAMLFSVTLLDFTASTPGGPGGDFSGIGPDVRDEPFGYGPIEVHNNNTMKTMEDMYNDTGEIVFGYTPRQFKPTAKFPFTAETNFTAKGLDPIAGLNNQIWELGNSLGMISGQIGLRTPIDMSVGPSNNEPGKELLDCYNKLNGGPQ